MKQCKHCNLSLIETAFRVKEVRNGVKKYASKCKVCEYMLTKNYDVPLPPNTKYCKLCNKILPTSNFTHNYGRCRACVNKQQRKNPDYVPNKAGEKTCKGCDCTLPITDFYTNGVSSRGTQKYGQLCKKCDNVKRHKKRKENPTEHRLLYYEMMKSVNSTPERLELRRVKRYGITLQRLEEMIVEQDNKCYLCGKDGSENLPYQKLAIDHCHKTNKVRKLLCTNCNVLLGTLKDDVDFLQKLIDYINLFKN